MRSLIKLALIPTVAITLASCGGSTENAVAQKQDGAQAATQQGNSTTKKEQSAHKMGEPVTNGGAILTVKSAVESPTTILDEKGKKKGYGQKIETTPTNNGAKFVKVTTTAKNDGTKPWDLTCGYGLDAKLITPKGAEMKPNGELYRIPENPDCSAHVNSGFETEMSWIFEVPTDMKLAESKFAFFDPSTNYGKPSFVSLAQ